MAAKTNPVSLGVLDELAEAAPKADTAETKRRIRGDRVNVQWWIKTTMHRKFKALALEKDLNLQALLDEAAGLLFARYGVGEFDALDRRVDEPKKEEAGE